MGRRSRLRHCMVAGGCDCIGRMPGVSVVARGVLAKDGVAGTRMGTAAVDDHALPRSWMEMGVGRYPLCMDSDDCDAAGGGLE